ncbi:hypothetical protein BH23VER1_BH23VER1_01870 [soil metagenome]
MVATVMPHGVLFRGGAEKEIRRKFLAYKESLVRRFSSTAGAEAASWSTRA